MDRFFAFAPTLASSLAVSLVAATLLVSHFRFDESIMLFAGLITAFAIISIVAFGVAHGRVQSSSGLLKVAIGLAVATLVLAAIPGGVDRITLHTTNPYINLNDRGGDIRLTLLIPALIAIVTQWRLVRRNWLRAHGQTESLKTAWPWVTTIVACIMILNPAGLAVLTSAIEQSPTDWLARGWLSVSLMIGAVLLLMGVIEWRIRSHALRSEATPSR